MEQSYCSKCVAKTDWIEYDDFWRCCSCGRRTYKMTYEEAQARLEKIQEDWARLEKSEFLQKVENKAIAEKFMALADQTLYHVRLINGSEAT